MSATFESYDRNPIGKGAVPGIGFIKQILKQKFHEVVEVAYKGSLEHAFYSDGKKYYILVKVPSETLPKFTYDVVFSFFPIKDTDTSATTLTNYNITLFSNDPDFVYTYMHVYRKNGMIDPELVPKCPEKVLQEKAVVRNPQGIANYSKIVYMAYLYIKGKGLTHKSYFTGSNFVIKDKDAFFNLVEDCESKINARISGFNDAKAKDKNFVHRLKRKAKHTNGKHVRKVSNVKKTSGSNRTTKTTKTTKRI